MQLHLDDCLKKIPQLAENTIDSIVTDPPYGIGMLSCDWDYGIPGAIFWKEMLRVCKPGSFLLAFGGTRTHHRLACSIEDAGWELKDMLMWCFGSGMPKSRSALKPAWEPIILAKKPYTGTLQDNVLKYGTGILNIEKCRVYRNANDQSGWSKSDIKASQNRALSGPNANRKATPDNPDGRWPANVITDGSEEVVGLFPIVKAGIAVGENSSASSKVYGGFKGEKGTKRIGYEGGGSAARFFYCAKASEKDRETYNTHPTVKPTALLQYLCRLVTPEKGIVLDPFMGSGSTGKAALLEGLDFIGIEKEKEYFDIATKRLTHPETIL